MPQCIVNVLHAKFFMRLPNNNIDREKNTQARETYITAKPFPKEILYTFKTRLALAS
jgi:hypothetical protein